MDRRAQAEWAGRHLQDALANTGPKGTFISRYSDPNHPASSGDPLALVTGGRVQLPTIQMSSGGRIGQKGAEKPADEGQHAPQAGSAGSAILPLLSGGLTLL